MKTKICNGKLCKGKEKPLSEFHKRSLSIDKLQHQCKNCVKEVDKVRYLKNKEKILKYGKEYRDKNKQKRKDYCDKNRNKIKKQTKQYTKNKLKNDISFKISHNLRCRINSALNGFTKSLNTMLLIGCEIDYFMYHIQKQFKRGMHWDNHGEWHIDHKSPCAKFDLSKPSEQRKCFHFSNLQPLWAIENIRKGSKIL